MKLNYSGLGTVLHARAVIGNRVEIGPGVVIGGRSEIWEVPVIEDDVQIGVGAKVLGPVRVGRGAIIGANAVVLHDVPPGAVVAGIPARILRRRVIDSGDVESRRTSATRAHEFARSTRHTCRMRRLLLLALYALLYNGLSHAADPVPADYLARLAAARIPRDAAAVVVTPLDGGTLALGRQRRRSP